MCEKCRRDGYVIMCDAGNMNIHANALASFGYTCAVAVNGPHTKHLLITENRYYIYVR